MSKKATPPAAAATAGARPRWRRAWAAIALVAITVVAYLPALRAGFIWDDPDYVINNANLRSLDGLRQIWLVPRSLPQYYPMVHTTFWAEFQLWDLSAPGYHAVNIALHATSAVLLWLLLRKLDVPGAWLAVAIFAVHPVHVESVAWVTERKNVLSLSFYLGAFLAYAKGSGFRAQGSGEAAEDGDSIAQPLAAGQRPRAPSSNDETLDRNVPHGSRGAASTARRAGALPRGYRFWYGLSLALFVAALLSKTVTCSLPAAILLVAWWKKGRLTWRYDVLPLVPFFAIGVAFAMWTAWLEREHVGATGAEWAFSAADRFLIAGRAVWFYAYKLVAPVNLAFIYPRWTIDDHAPLQYAFPIAAAALVLVLFVLRHRIGRGPLVAVLLFGGTLLPALGFFNLYPMRYSFVADHFQYHASLGLIVLIAAMLIRVSGKPAVVAAVVIPVLIILTMRQATIYRDVETLWRDTLAKNPESWMVHTNLGHALVARGERLERSGAAAGAHRLFDEATGHYERALELAPHLPEPHWNVGVSLAIRGRPDEALAQFDEAIRLSNDTLPQARFSRGNVLRERGDVAGAMAEYARAVEIKPDYAEAHYNLAVLLEREGRLDEAIAHYERAVANALDYEDAHYNLANAMRARRRFDEALVHYSQVLRINPRRADAATNLGATFFDMGRYDDAARAFRAALSIDPTLVPARRGLAAAQQRGGRG